MFDTGLYRHPVSIRLNGHQHPLSVTCNWGHWGRSIELAIERWSYKEGLVVTLLYGLVCGVTFLAHCYPNPTFSNYIANERRFMLINVLLVWRKHRPQDGTFTRTNVWRLNQKTTIYGCLTKKITRPPSSLPLPTFALPSFTGLIGLKAQLSTQHTFLCFVFCY